MRTFVAISLPDKIKARLAAVIQNLRRSNIHAAWVKPDNLHLTMKFLGEVEEKQLQQITRLLDSIGREEKTFTVALNGFGFLPCREKPRILYITTDQQERLIRLATNLEQQLATLGFQPERHFTPHVTISRIKRSKNLEHLKSLIDESGIDMNLSINSLNLYRSTLHADGARYELLHQGYFRK